LIALVRFQLRMIIKYGIKVIENDIDMVSNLKED
jgi:hypothetical protein